MIFINFKTYQQGTGESALSLAKICAEVEKETGIKIIPIVQVVDIFRLASQGLNVWAQHVFTPGAKGVLLNHAEKKLSWQDLKKIMEKRQDFQTLVCSESLEEGQQIAILKPDFLAYEPPELIGGTVSVSQAKPEIISDFVAKIKEVPVLVGAGIHNKEDIKKALELGVKGVLVSSDIVLSENPKQELLNLAGGFLS
ncbi:triose-phosphate isomerase [Candidatus Shapirobacteria bacterium CG10_big_fil_rev_8_21_14_0_10_38_8]|nr:MAG: triose-phosphate isomerase [Candidatus Shapirobacteria bacterium CG10_big_fil_rev_8_21_14_0_10_38_8]